MKVTQTTKIVSATTEGDLNDKINGFLKDGYKLHGYPFVFDSGLCQMMTLEKFVFESEGEAVAVIEEKVSNITKTSKYEQRNASLNEEKVIYDTRPAHYNDLAKVLDAVEYLESKHGYHVKRGDL